MTLDLDKVEKLLDELLKQGDLQHVQQILLQLDTVALRIRAICYETDQVVDAMTERSEYFLEGEAYDS